MQLYILQREYANTDTITVATALLMLIIPIVW